MTIPIDRAFRTLTTAQVTLLAKRYRTECFCQDGYNYQAQALALILALLGDAAAGALGEHAIDDRGRLFFTNQRGQSCCIGHKLLTHVLPSLADSLETRPGQSLMTTTMLQMLFAAQYSVQYGSCSPRHTDTTPQYANIYDGDTHPHIDARTEQTIVGAFSVITVMNDMAEDHGMEKIDARIASAFVLAGIWRMEVLGEPC